MDSSELPGDQPAEKFSTSLGLRFIKRSYLPILQDDAQTYQLPAFRNNLVAQSHLYDVLFVANRSAIEMYRLDALTACPVGGSYGIVDTRPPETTEQMRAGANWPAYPHGINSLRLSTLSDEEVLVSAGDDGKVLIFSTKELWELKDHAKPLAFVSVDKSAWGIDIHNHHRLLAVSDNSAHAAIFKIPHRTDTRITPQCERIIVSPPLMNNIPDIEFVPSVQPETCHLAAISISGQIVVWEFYFGRRLSQFEPRQLHMDDDDEDNRSESDDDEGRDGQLEMVASPIDLVSHRRRRIRRRRASSIAFTDTLRTGSGDSGFNELDDDHDGDNITGYMHDLNELDEGNGNDTFASRGDDDNGNVRRHPNARNMYQDYYDKQAEKIARASEYGICVSYENLKQQGWTANCVSARDFKQVPSFYEAIGNKWINEDVLFKKMQTDNSSILRTPSTEDDLYPRVRFSSFEIETQLVQRRGSTARSSLSGVPFYALALCDREKKMKEFVNQRQKTPHLLVDPHFKDEFVIFTSKKSLYLCQLEDFYCNAARSNVFYWESPYGSGEVYYDRLSIVQVVKELSAVIVVSQVGAISVFRLTRYRGVFCMRQEYVFPVVETFLFNGARLRVIGGVAVAPVRTSSGLVDRVRITVVYLDGLVVSYELFIRQEEKDQLEIML